MKACDVLSILNVTHRTLSNYVKQGKLHPVVLGKTHYEYNESEVFALMGKNQERMSVTYSRVSLAKQKRDLESQTKRLYDFSNTSGIILSEQIEDIKSGMSFQDRKGFVRLIKLVSQYKIDKVVIENRDRLCRFGFELVEMMFKNYGTSIIVMSESENRTYEQELTDDLISIIHYYSMKSYSNRRKLHKAEKLLKSADTEVEI